MGKKDFRDFADAQRYLYSLAEKLEKHELSPSEATAAARIVDSWGKVHKLKTNADIIRRINGLEELYKSKNGGKV